MTILIRMPCGDKIDGKDFLAHIEQCHICFRERMKPNSTSTGAAILIGAFVVFLIAITMFGVRFFGG